MLIEVCDETMDNVVIASLGRLLESIHEDIGSHREKYVDTEAPAFARGQYVEDMDIAAAVAKVLGYYTP
jgi:hypothetical protein